MKLRRPIPSTMSPKTKPHSGDQRYFQRNAFRKPMMPNGLSSELAASEENARRLWKRQ